MEKVTKTMETRECLHYKYWCDVCGKEINNYQRYSIDSNYHTHLDLDLCLECINKINSEFDEVLKPIIDKYKKYEAKEE